MQHDPEWCREGKGIRHGVPRGCLGGHEGVEGELSDAPESKLGVLYQDRYCERGICRSGAKSITGDVLEYQPISSRDLAWTGRFGAGGVGATQAEVHDVDVDRLLLWIDCRSGRGQKRQRQECCCDQQRHSSGVHQYLPPWGIAARRPGTSCVWWRTRE